MKKTNYEFAEIEIMVLDNVDVICTSDINGGTGGSGDLGGGPGDNGEDD